MTMLRIATAAERCEQVRLPERAGIRAPEAQLRFPPYAPGMKIGLFGGSFNPPHEAHRAASLLGLKRLDLDRVWWLVTPGNPLKDTRRLPSLAARIEAARKVARHPRIEVTGVEALIGTCYTYQTIFRLVQRCPGVRFVWMMGADNLAGFDRWRNWRGIAALVPIAVIDRGGVLNALASPAAHWLASSRIPEAQAKQLPFRRPPAMIFVHGMKSRLSSSLLRHEPG